MITIEEVDAVALEMCYELGVDPGATVTYDVAEDIFPFFSHGAPHETHVPHPGAPPYVVRRTTSGPQWRSFRRQAAITIAAWQATHKLMLLKK